MRRSVLLGVLLGLLIGPPAHAAGPGAGPALGVAVDPVDTQRVYAVDLTGVRRSDDGGATFRPLRLPRVIGVARRVVAVAGSVFVSGDERVFRSADGGVTWRAAPISARRPIVQPPGDANLVVAEGPDGGDAGPGPLEGQLVASRNGGASWARLPMPVDGVVTALALGAGGVVVTVATFAGDSHFATTDLGAHWTDVTAAWPASRQGPVADVAVAGRLWLSESGEAGKPHPRLLRSDDLGATWTDVGPAPPGQLISVAGGLVAAATPAGLRPFASTVLGAGLLRSADGGGTFAPDTAGLPAASGVAAYARAGAAEVLATAYGGFHRSGGGPWLASTSMGPGVVRDLVHDGARLYAGTPDGAFLSRDRGRTWSAVAGLSPHADVAELAALHGRVAVAVDGVAPAVYAGRAGRVLHRVAGLPAGSVVRGLAYEPSGALLVATQDRLLRLRGNRLSRVHRFARTVRGFILGSHGRILVVVAARETALLESADGGRTFAGRQLAGSESTLSRLYPAGRGFYLDGELLVFSADGRSLAAGESPSALAGSHARIAALPGVPRVAWAADDGGISRTHDGGAHWTRVVRDTRGGSAVLIDGRDLVYATLGRGVRHRPLVVGDLTVPRLTARYDAVEHAIVGRVADLRPGSIRIEFGGEAAGGDGEGGIALVTAAGEFAIPVVGELQASSRFSLVARDRAGNVSRRVVVAVP